MQSEINELKATIAESEKKEKIGELNSAIASFTDEEKAYAQAEIDAFNADPIASEVNSVVSKIWEGVGKKAKTDAAQVAAEQNAVNTNYEDIFSEVGGKTAAAEDTNIF
jgi:membrane protein involved in colicin uptake